MFEFQIEGIEKDFWEPTLQVGISKDCDLASNRRQIFTWLIMARFTDASVRHHVQMNFITSLSDSILRCLILIWYAAPSLRKEKYINSFGVINFSHITNFKWNGNLIYNFKVKSI